MTKIYLDYAATTPLCEEACQTLLSYYTNFGNDSLDYRGNANSLYEIGRKSHLALEESRKMACECLGASRPTEIAFTSGSTESIFIALDGLYHANGCENIISTEIEHSAVANTIKYLDKNNSAIFLKPDKFGYISPDDLDEKLKDNPKCLVSICMANSEIATIQNIKRLCEVAHKRGALFHSDITQAVGKTYVNLKELGVDSACLSSHKFGGPTGVGILYVKNATKFSSPIVGGGQESALRGGTQNVAGIVAMTSALVATCANLDDEIKKCLDFKRKIRQTVPNIKNDKGACKNTLDEDGAKKVHEDIDFLSNIAHILLPKIESEVALLRFDELGISVSGGSACSSHSLKASKTLRAIGIDEDSALCALRVSFGRYTTKGDIDAFLSALKEVILWTR